MFALTVPPPPAEPAILSGYVVQARYGIELERLVPFDPDDEDYDLRFRDWFPNGFAFREHAANEIHQAQIAGGFQSRILPGVAERQPNNEFHFFTVH